MKLTRKYLEKNGWYGKYKSCHTRWCKNGVCIDQHSDEDYEGSKIEEVDKFYYDWNDVGTIERLGEIYHNKTGEMM
jgi:hypothetical protein